MEEEKVEVTAVSTPTHWTVDLTDGAHRWRADEPNAAGGQDTGPNPMRLLCASLAACTNITVQMYAQHKQWPLERIEVIVTMNPNGKPQDGATDLDRRVRLSGPLDAGQRERLLEIATHCPTHKILAGAIRVPTRVEEA